MEIIRKITGDIGASSLVGSLRDASISVSGTTTIPERLSEYPTYSGDTTVTPDARTDIVLETNQKVLKSDITVAKIPTYETSNAYGTTFIIGG